MWERNSAMQQSLELEQLLARMQSKAHWGNRKGVVVVVVP